MAESDDIVALPENPADREKRPIGPNDYFVAVMGVTGVGKSSFIQHLSGERVEIGHTLEACTQKVDFYPVEYNDDTTIWLLDTPGFDDTNRTDSQVLKEIAAYLASPQLYHNGKSKLDGIIYLHRILDLRMGGSAQTNLFMFQRLCGPEALTNVILATTMWERVSEHEGKQREDELKSTDRFWGGMIANGSTVYRHLNTRESAMKIIEHFINIEKPREEERMVLDLQKELVDQKLDLNLTGAGQEVDHGLAKARDGFQEKINELQVDLATARELKNEELEAAVLAQRSKMETQVQQLMQQQEDLKVNVKQLYEEKLAAMQQKLDHYQKHPLVRSHPPNVSPTQWNATMSLFGEKYWFNSLRNNLRSTLPDVPENCRAEHKGHNNQCVALGEDNSWYIHYQTFDQQTKSIERSVFSKNFGTLYPGAYKFLHVDHQDQPPTCVSLGIGGYYFVHTTAGCDFNLPQEIKDAVGDPSSKESIWLGANNTWVCQWSTDGENGEKMYEWSADLKTHYQGMRAALEDSKKKIRALALNPTDSEQWTILWDDGHTMYGLGQQSTWLGWKYEEWCTQNFGSTWSTSRPQYGYAADPPGFGILFLSRFRRRLKPWKYRFGYAFVPPAPRARRESNAR